MAIIDPHGMFHGERLATCSDNGQNWWPRLYSAANGYARLELSYQAIIAECFCSYRRPPSEDELWAVFEEYATNFLVILFESDGIWWAEFDTSQKYLPKYKTRRDETSPAPTLDARAKHRSGYLEWKRSKSLPNQRFQKFFESSEKFAEVSDGIGIGIGVGDGVVEKQKPSRVKRERRPDERHVLFKGEVQKYWDSKNPGDDMPWGPAEGRQMGIFLRKAPSITLERFTGLLRNRFKSDVNHSDDPCKWLAGVMKYASGPIDRYGKPMTGDSNGRGEAGDNKRAGAAVHRADIGVAALHVAARRAGTSYAVGTDGFAVSPPRPFASD